MLMKQTNNGYSTYQNNSEFRLEERKFKKSFATETCLELPQKISLIREGVLVLKGALDTSTQAIIVRQALEEYSKPPNLSNLDAHYNMPSGGIWNQFKSNPYHLIEPRIFESPQPQIQTISNSKYDEYCDSKENKQLIIDPPTGKIFSIIYVRSKA